MSKKDEALKLALDALILKAGINPVMQGSCYVMHPEALQAVIDEAIKQAQTQTVQEPVQNRSALTLDRPMTFGGCPFCGSQSCVAGQCRSATAPVRVPDKHLQLALGALAPLEKLFTQADEQGLLAGANVDCQIATNDLRKSAYAASDIRTHLNTNTPAAPVPLTADQREEIAKGWRGRNWSVGDIIDATEAARGITKGGAL
jgi:hypothetical protein